MARIFSKWETREGRRAGRLDGRGRRHGRETGPGGIRTKQGFGDVQLHIEWATPSPARGTGQDRGNSGVFFQSTYEVQVLDSFQNETYWHGSAGSVYKQYAPLVNASRKPGEWQVYDIVYHAPAFNADGRVTKRATFTVFHNGVLIQDHVEVMGVTTNEGPPYLQGARGQVAAVASGPQPHGEVPEHLGAGDLAPQLARARVRQERAGRACLSRETRSLRDGARAPCGPEACLSVSASPCRDGPSCTPASREGVPPCNPPATFQPSSAAVLSTAAIASPICSRRAPPAAAGGAPQP